jgi:antiviral helicase SLH1
VYLEDFALVSDAAYVAQVRAIFSRVIISANHVSQNAARIIRALLEIALSRNWSNCAILLIDLSKAIEHRMWPYEHPLAQITTLHRDTLHNLRQWADDTEIAQLREMDPQVLGELVHMNEKHGLAIRDAALMFPTVDVEYALRPLSHDLLQISVCVRPQFQWNAKVSTSGEPFYVWIQDEEGINILQWRSILLRQTTTKVDIDFLIPLTDIPPASYTIISASDRWLGSDHTRMVPLDDLVMPSPTTDVTPMLDIPYLHISALDDPQLETMYRPFIQTMNGIQSQAFWSVYHTQSNVLVSAPVASGKSFMGEVALW